MNICSEYVKRIFCRGQIDKIFDFSGRQVIIIRVTPIHNKAVTRPLHGGKRYWIVIAGVLVLAIISLGTAGASFAMDLGLHVPASLAAWSISPATQAPAPPAGSAMSSKRVLDWETGEGKSYLIPAIEVPAFNALLNGFDRLVYANERENGKRIYESNMAIWWDNVTDGHWGFDQDAFATNQFSHPYAGTIYYGFARSAGLNYWESLAYTFTGSWLWETAGETTKPSINDQVASGIAGTLFGEPLFRIANLTLEGGGERPGLLRQLLAAALAPSAAFNRYVFGDRFRPVFPSHDPAIFWRLRLGEAINSHGATTITPSVVTADYAMSYGLPGKPGYRYERPFDYFNLEINALGHARNPVENIMVRGLLAGDKYEAGDDYRGAWGLYGSYDFISPHIFRVSSTALSIGTTAQWWLTRKAALQGTVMGGIGYGAAGVISGPGQRDYHYGVSFQGLLDLRLGFDDLAMVNVTTREYYVTGLGGTQPRGDDIIGRWNVGLTVRVYGRHALGIQYLSSTRNANYRNGQLGTHQTAEAYSITYTYLSDTHFGSVEWRGAPARSCLR
jgi:hypothetical protein